jgi:hypothetical protein
MFSRNVDELSSDYTASQRSRDNAVATATSYGLDDRGVGVRAPLVSRIFSFLRRPDRF